MKGPVPIQQVSPSDIKSVLEEYIKKHLTVDVSVSCYKGAVDAVTVQLMLDDVVISEKSAEAYNGCGGW